MEKKSRLFPIILGSVRSYRSRSTSGHDGLGKAAHPEAKTTGWHLREADVSEHMTAWWRTLPDEDKEIIMSIPNFDMEIFKKITGIKQLISNASADR